MGRRKCSSFPACFVGDDSLVLFSCLLFYVDEEQRDSPSRQVSRGFFLESFFLFVPCYVATFLLLPVCILCVHVRVLVFFGSFLCFCCGCMC
jgi:hypothetical protein